MSLNRHPPQPHATVYISLHLFYINLTLSSNPLHAHRLVRMKSWNRTVVSSKFKKQRYPDVNVVYTVYSWYLACSSGTKPRRQRSQRPRRPDRGRPAQAPRTLPLPPRKARQHNPRPSLGPSPGLAPAANPPANLKPPRRRRYVWCWELELSLSIP